MLANLLFTQATVKHLDEIIQVFTLSVSELTSKEYSEAQQKVWANAGINKEKWIKRLAEQYFVIAHFENQPAGFASLTTSGYVDVLYVHPSFVRKGIGLALLNHLQTEAIKLNVLELTSDVSETAKPLFLSFGFKAMHKNEFELEGQFIHNYKMIKSIV
ncbi:MAG: GNAT family N-acetyltransferase [Cyclobacteriaceae bacterium]|nr:GNAT family N-acetyltransferase [Cyclobacteriaceae bacterium]